MLKTCRALAEMAGSKRFTIIVVNNPANPHAHRPQSAWFVRGQPNDPVISAILRNLASSSPLALQEGSLFSRVLPCGEASGSRGSRADPKGAMEADLFIAGAGAFIIVMGGLVAVAGVHRAWTTSNAPNPHLEMSLRSRCPRGSCLAWPWPWRMWWCGWRGVVEGPRPQSKPGQKDDLLESIRDDGHRDQST